MWVRTLVVELINIWNVNGVRGRLGEEQNKIGNISSALSTEHWRISFYILCLSVSWWKKFIETTLLKFLFFMLFVLYIQRIYWSRQLNYFLRAGKVFFLSSFNWGIEKTKIDRSISYRWLIHNIWLWGGAKFRPDNLSVSVNFIIHHFCRNKA